MRRLAAASTSSTHRDTGPRGEDWEKTRARVGNGFHVARARTRSARTRIVGKSLRPGAVAIILKVGLDRGFQRMKLGRLAVPISASVLAAPSLWAPASRAATAESAAAPGGTGPAGRPTQEPRTPAATAGPADTAAAPAVAAAGASRGYGGGGGGGGDGTFDDYGWWCDCDGSYQSCGPGSGSTSFQIPVVWSDIGRGSPGVIIFEFVSVS